jgi:hypothetical protein
MRSLRNHIGVFAAMAITWQAFAIAAVSVVLSWEHAMASGQNAMEESCPLHSRPACPLHAEKHGTHECDCPTIGCEQTSTAFIGLFGAVGILPPPVGAPESFGSSKAATFLTPWANLFAPVPLSPPPRS